MGGRRRPKCGVVRIVDRLDGPEGMTIRRAYAALATALGPFHTELARMEASRTALAWANLVTATRALAAARRARERARGRRPGSRELERLQRRQALQDASYGQALDKLRELAAPNGHGRRPPSPEELAAQIRADQARDG